MAIPPPTTPLSQSPQFLATSASAAATAATAAATAAVAGDYPDHLAAALEANKYRLAAVVTKLGLYFNGHVVLGQPDVLLAFSGLARAIDYALSGDVVPANAHMLPPLIKQVFQYRNDPALRYAVMMVMISCKNACKNKWFLSTDTDELLKMANELCTSFCLSFKDTNDVGDVIDTISKIIPRFYPQLKFGQLFVSFEAKPGYDILMADFQIPRNIPPEEKITLLVVHTDNLERSSCIISPQQVSFLVNGKGIEGRTNCSMDAGPQFPTDLTKTVKYGTNIFQAIGYFSGNYMIAVVSMTKMTSPHLPKLEDYAYPVAAKLVSDSDIIEGPSRITINCPISFKRIKIPAKGHLCKHHQCFDYDNFIEMNLRKPSWRCPCCNTPVSCIDLRFDQNMAKILREAGEDVSKIVYSADGSWKPLGEHNETWNQLHNDWTVGHQDVNLESETSKLANLMDLTTEEYSESERRIGSKELQPLQGSLNGGESGDNIMCDIEDRKPFTDNRTFSVTFSHTESVGLSNAFESPTTTAYSTGVLPQFVPSSCGSVSLAITATETLVPNAMLNPIQTDAVTPHVQDHIPSTGLPQTSLVIQNIPQARQLAEDMLLPQSYIGGSAISNEISRHQIPRNVTRNPIAIQALPAPMQAPISSRRMHSSSLNSPVILNRNTSVPFQTLTSSTSVSNGFNSANSQLEIEQRLRAPGLASSSLQRHSVTQVIGLAAPNLSHTLAPQEQLRGAGVNRATLQPPVENLNSRQLANQRFHSPTTNPQPFRRPSTQVQQVFQSSGSPASIQNRSNALMTTQRAAEAAIMRAAAARNLSTTRVASVPAAADTCRSQPSAISSGMPGLQPERNWQPTGRMRGSLTGTAYSAALSQYLDPPAQPAQSRRTTHADNTQDVDPGRQPGGSS